MDIVYRGENRSPNESIRISMLPAYSAINAAAIVTGMDWCALVKKLIEQAHERANMPTEKTCVTNMLRVIGFQTISLHGNNTMENCIACCRSGQSYSSYIVELDGLGYFAFVPSNETEGAYVLCGCKEVGQRFYPGRSRYRRVKKLWGYMPGTDNRTGIVRNGYAIKHRYDEHTGFKVVNLNPKGIGVGDCAVRALAAVYGCSWHEAVDLLAETNGYIDPEINSHTNIDATLIRLGFARHNMIRRNGSMLDGRAFCDLMTHTFFKGERIFVQVGTSHAVAALPIEENGTVRYSIQDTWDSTTRKIREYWVYDPKEKERAARRRGKELPADMAVGASLVHPKFGKGEILNEKDLYVEVRFETCGVKRISKDWFRQAN